MLLKIFSVHFSPRHAEVSTSVRPEMSKKLHRLQLKTPLLEQRRHLNGLCLNYIPRGEKKFICDKETWCWDNPQGSLTPEPHCTNERAKAQRRTCDPQRLPPARVGWVLPCGEGPRWRVHYLYREKQASAGLRNSILDDLYSHPQTLLCSKLLCLYLEISLSEFDHNLAWECCAEIHQTGQSEDLSPWAGLSSLSANSVPLWTHLCQTGTVGRVQMDARRTLCMCQLVW